jgi:hypothetical protein
VDVPVTVMVVLDFCTGRSQDVITESVRALNVLARNVRAARAVHHNHSLQAAVGTVAVDWHEHSPRNPVPLRPDLRRR